MLVAVDCETTGLDPRIHDLHSLAIVPLTDEYEQDPNVPAFTCKSRPRRPETIEASALKVTGVSVDEIMAYPPAQEGIAALSAWLTAHVYPRGFKVLHPLAHNWTFDSAFITHWLDPEGRKPRILGRVFHYHARDSQQVALFYINHAKRSGKSADLPFTSDRKSVV